MTNSSTSEERPAPATLQFLLNLLQEATEECASYDDITIISDNIAQLPCRNSKTWRKDHGWSDLEAESSHSSSRWESAKLPRLPNTSCHRGEEGVSLAPPSAPTRRNSVSSVDLNVMIKPLRQDSISSLCSASSASSSSASSFSSTSTAGSNRRTKAFQYPSALGQLPEESECHEIPLAFPLPPRSQIMDESNSRMPCMPQRQPSESSFNSQSSFASQNTPVRGSDTMPRLHRNMNLPPSLFSAPCMPQRQDSVSTIGSVSTLLSHDSSRSLVANTEQREFQIQPTVVEEDEDDHHKEFSITPEDVKNLSPKKVPQVTVRTPFLMPTLPVQ